MHRIGASDLTTHDKDFVLLVLLKMPHTQRNHNVFSEEDKYRPQPLFIQRVLNLSLTRNRQTSEKHVQKLSSIKASVKHSIFAERKVLNF